MRAAPGLFAGTTARSPLSDITSGSPADDVLNGTDGADTITGLDGDDELYGRGGADSLDGGAGDDILAGGSGADRLTGGADFDALSGGSGDDVIDGGAGADRFDGGSGFDVATYAAAAGAVAWSAEDGGTLGDAIGDQFTAIEALQGSSFNDTLGGGRSIALLRGGDGADTLASNAPSATLIGGRGADVLSGWNFVYESLADSTRKAPDMVGGLGRTSVIDVSAIDADETIEGDQAFTIVGAFTGHAGEVYLKYKIYPDLTVIQFDTDGDQRPDLQIYARGDEADYDNFVL
jgi:Ca2+-binding RTX toxin-like protein